MAPLTYHTDTAIIGAGTAGLTAHRTLLKNGVPSLLIEKSYEVHTTCAAVGCMPSKLLIAAAHARHVAHQAQTVFGSISHLDAAPNDELLWARIQTERNRFTSLVHQGAAALTLPLWATDTPLNGLITGTCASLLSYEPTQEYPFTLKLQKETTVQLLKAKKLIQATGSAPYIPTVWAPHLHLQGFALHTNETIFELKKTPATLAVIGAGVIGIELSTAFHQLGVATHLISHTQPSTLLGLSSASSIAYAKNLGDLGVQVHLGVSVVKAEYDVSAAMWTLYMSDTSTVCVEQVLLATGRTPQRLPGTDTIGGGHQLVIGDASSLHPLLHEAALDGAYAYEWWLCHAVAPQIGGLPISGHHQQGFAREEITPLRIVFGYPQVAVVGTVPKNRGPQGYVSFEDQGRSRVQAENSGHLSLWFDEQHQLLAAEIVHPRAEHLAHLLAWAMQARQTLEQLLAMPFFHPVIEEGVRTALRKAKTTMDANAGMV